MNVWERNSRVRRDELISKNNKYLSQPILYREVEYIVFGFGKTTRAEAI